MKPQKKTESNANKYQIYPYFNHQYNQLLKVADPIKKNLDYSEILQSVLNGIDIGIIVINKDNLIIYYNQKFLEMWQIPESLLFDNKLIKILNYCIKKIKNGKLILPSEIKNIDNNNSLIAKNLEKIIQLKNGIFLEQSCKLIKLSEKEIGRIWMFRDVTEQQNMEEDLRQILEQEKEASQIKTRFVSMLSHELRTPLNMISFSNSLLKRHAARWTEEKMHSYFSRIQMAVEQISYLMDTILLIGRAELGKLTFEPQLSDLNNFCLNLIEEFKNHNANYSLIYQSSEEKLLVSFDQNLLHIALSNLISNAFKYSPLKSKIELSLTCKEQMALLEVKDQGIGIPSQAQQHLFEAFYRGSNVGEIPGNGLGLAVVKKIIEAHGGKITVVSTLNVGTTFTLILPINNY